MNDSLLPVVLLLLALLVWALASRTRQAAGLPEGEVVYADTGGWSRPEQPLFSRRLQLAGKPDYLVSDGGVVVPVEVKSGSAPPGGPHPGHVYQLAAYCALVHEAYGQRPAYGLVRYADQTLRVEYTSQLEAGLEQILAQMRADAAQADVPRSHESPARCRACGLREACDAGLA